MGWNERSDPDMRTANFCDVYREGVYLHSSESKMPNLSFDLNYISHDPFNRSVLPVETGSVVVV